MYSTTKPSKIGSLQEFEANLPVILVEKRKPRGLEIIWKSAYLICSLNRKSTMQALSGIKERSKSILSQGYFVYID